MKKRLNWPLWAGFLLSVVAFFSYFALFVRYPVTRDFPWANLLLFALAAILLAWGLRRAFAQSALYRGKIFGPILTVLSVAVLGFFCYGMFVAARQLPSAQAAPQVGQKAPDFTLLDTKGRPVSLNGLLTGLLPGKGVLLVFYRGYW